MTTNPTEPVEGHPEPGKGPEPVEGHPEPGKGPEPVEGPSNPEDAKIITLARSALARTGAAQGCCLRDTDGRTYAGTSVDLDRLKLSAVQVVVAMAVSSGAQGVEAVAVAGVQPDGDDLAVVGELPGSGVIVWGIDPTGAVQNKIELA